MRFTNKISILALCTLAPIAVFPQGTAKTTKRPAPPATTAHSEEQTISTFWQLTFITGLPEAVAPAFPFPPPKPAEGPKQPGDGTKQGGTAGQDGPGSTQQKAPADPLIEALKSAVGATDEDLKITRLQDGLSITGKESFVNRTTNLLARYIDVPASQVKLDVYAFQLNEQLHVARNLVPKMDLVKQGIEKVRLYEQHMVAEISEFVGRARFDEGINESKASEIVHLFKKFRLIDENQHGTNLEILTDAKSRPKSLIETLLYSSMIDNTRTSAELYKQLNRNNGIVDLVCNDIDNQNEIMKRTSGQEHTDAEKLRDLYQSIRDRLKTSNKHVFEHTLMYFRSPGIGDVNTILSFLKAWADENESGTVVRSKSFIIDLMIQQISNAIQEDMKELFQDPLMGWTRGVLLEGGGSIRGINYAGHISVATSNREPVTLAGIASSTRKVTTYSLPGSKKATDSKTTPTDGATTPPAGGASTPPAGGATDTKDKSEPKSGLGSLVTNSFAGKVSPQLELLFNVLESRQEQYYTIAPGISFGARPTVMADGSTAFLQLQLMLTADATDTGDKKLASNFDTIKMTPLATKVQVSSFDLFPVSSFSMQTATKGDPRWEIPGLSSIPIIGNIFRGPSGTERRQQEVVMFISAAIVPRAIDLTSRYSGRD